MKRLLQITLITFVIAGLTTVASAQQSDNDNIQANATVIAQLDVTAGSPLNFGDVTPGISSSVAYGSGGSFSISGGGGASVILDFTLPTNLTSGGNNLPISFSTTDANWEDGTTSNGNNVFDPNSPETITFPSDGDMSVFIGGTVTPDNTQAAGTYSGTIVLTATYN